MGKVLVACTSRLWAWALAWRGKSVAVAVAAVMGNWEGGTGPRTGSAGRY